MAHVIAHSPQGPRGVSDGGEDTYENLILLCPTHHRTIDKAPEGTFTTTTLLEWKKHHEAKINTMFRGIIFPSFSDVKREISRILTENKVVWMTFGPESSTAIQNPLSNLYLHWHLRKLDTIIPNNHRIIGVLEANMDKLNAKQLELFFHFKQHATGFEHNAYERLENYPRFPQEFAQEFEHEQRF